MLEAILEEQEAIIYRYELTHCEKRHEFEVVEFANKDFYRLLLSYESGIAY